MTTILATNRLLLREFLIEDAQSFYELNADPEVMRYTGDSAFESVSQAEDFIRNYDEYNKNGFGRWSVILKSTNKFIGWCGLKLDEENMVDIGYRFFKKEWGKGYATESAKACLAYGFHELKLPEIIGRSAFENKASIRVLEKLGMQFWKKKTCKGIENAVYYKIACDQFLV